MDLQCVTLLKSLLNMSKFQLYMSAWCVLSNLIHWPMEGVIIISKVTLSNSCYGLNSCEIVPRWMPQNPKDEMSTPVRVMVWQAPSLTSANVDPDLCRHMASLGHNDFIIHTYLRDTRNLGSEKGIKNNLWYSTYFAKNLSVLSALFLLSSISPYIAKSRHIHWL